MKLNSECKSCRRRGISREHVVVGSVHGHMILCHMVFGELLMCVQVVVTFMHVRQDSVLPPGNGVARIFFWGGPIFRDLRRPTRFGGGGGSSRNFPGSP